MIERISRISRRHSIAAGCIGLIAVGAIDYLSGSEIRISVFYLAPIFLITWNVGIKGGIATSVGAAFIEALTNVMAGQTYSSSLILYWNTAIETLSFLVVAFITLVLKNAYDREKAVARKDFLTGIANRQAFVDLVEMEIARSRRYSHPLTIAYIDCDNFKAVNDTLGHVAGDRALRAVAETMVKNIRVTDIVARLGGDEFALFLPETGALSAKEAVSKVRTVLLEEMRGNDLPVTFSIGVATFVTPPDSVDEMLSKADALMYSVKNGSKDTVKCAEY